MSDLNDFVIENGVLKKYTGTDENVVIPDGVEVIGRGAFDSLNLNSIIIPNSVIKIEKYAILSPAKITVPQNVKKLGFMCFAEGSTVYGLNGSAAERWILEQEGFGDYGYISIGTAIPNEGIAIKGKDNFSRAVAELENAVLTDAEQIHKLISRYTFFEFSARALGFACRLGDLKTVKAMVEHGITFDYNKADTKLCSKYHLCHKSPANKYYFDPPILMVADNIWDRYLFGDMDKVLLSTPPAEQYSPYVGNKISEPAPTPLQKGDGISRKTVLMYLFEKGLLDMRTCNRMLYYAILEQDSIIVETLSNLGAFVDVPWIVAHLYKNDYLPHLKHFLDKMSEKEIAQQAAILRELNFYIAKGGGKFNLVKQVAEFFDFGENELLTNTLLTCATLSGISKAQYTKKMLKAKNGASMLSTFLKSVKISKSLLNELIEISISEKLVECTAVLLQEKNYSNEEMSKLL